MTLTVIFEKYLDFIWKAFMFDMNVFSNQWMYWPLLLPVMAYTTFFVSKWIVIFFPVFLPIGFIINGFGEYLTKIKIWIKRIKG